VFFFFLFSKFKSHNRITTDGLRLLLDYFLISKKVKDDGSNNQNHIEEREPPILATLNLSDNNIRSEGGRSIGHMLRSNSSLIDLNISLNRLEDEGGKLVMDGLRQNGTLQRINIASNSLSTQSITILSKVLEESEQCPTFLETNYTYNSCLEEIDLSSNELSDKDVVRLMKAVKVNTKLVSLDLRCQQGVAAVVDSDGGSTNKKSSSSSRPTLVFESAIDTINQILLNNEKNIDAK
jgi:hypothetical protein